MCDCDVEEMFMASMESAPAEETEVVDQPVAVPLVLTVKKKK